MKQLLFSLKEGSVSYHKKEILKELDINIHRKDFIALVGKNGAGTVSYTHLRAHET